MNQKQVQDSETDMPSKPMLGSLKEGIHHELPNKFFQATRPVK